MLAELAAANAAFAVIKQVVKNGSDIVKAGSAIAKFVGAKEDLQRKTGGKNRSSASGDTLQAFLALEQIRNQEQELKEFMIYCGRPGLWSDWVKYQAQARKDRRNQEREELKQRKKRLYILAVCGLVFLGFLAIAGIVGLIYLNSTR